MNDDIQKETERIHQGIVESLSFSEALAKRDAEIERLKSELNMEVVDRRKAEDEIERLRGEAERRSRVEDERSQRAVEMENAIERLRGLVRELWGYSVTYSIPVFGTREYNELWDRIREALGE